MRREGLGYGIDSGLFDPYANVTLVWLLSNKVGVSGVARAGTSVF